MGTLHFVQPVIIAVDGPSAAGKGTIARMLAEALGYDYLDTGALYRAVGYYAIQQEIDLSDTEAILRLIDNIDFTNIADLDLHNDEVGKIASSYIAVQPEVREVLNRIQKHFPEGKKGAVIDGRDIGTVIFPNADLKLFITADLQVRAERRYKQLQNWGKQSIYGEVLKDLQARDARDSGRSAAPLMRAEDAVVIDTTSLDVQSAVDKVLKLVRETFQK